MKEWRPFGRKSKNPIIIQANQHKLGKKTVSYIGVKVNVTFTPKEAIRFSEAIIRAVKYTKKGVEWHEKTKRN